MRPSYREHPDRLRYRLPGHDYQKPAGYFVTVCTRDRSRIFGSIRNGVMHLNDFGRIADMHWKSLSDHFPYVRLDNHVVMPDHIHGIINIVEQDSTDERREQGQCPSEPSHAGPRLAAAVNGPTRDDDGRPWRATALRDNVSESSTIDSNLAEIPHRIARPKTGSLGMIMGAYKSGVTREINRLMRNPGITVWQYRFHERIIRTNASRARIRRYIENNPARWSIDHPGT